MQGPIQAISQPRVTMLQDGTRRRYIVPVALQRAGILERVYTDWLLRKGSVESALTWLLNRVKPQLAGRISQRICPELDPRLVRSNPMLALSLHSGRVKHASPEDSYLYNSQRTTEWILKAGFGNANIFYGFIRNASPDLFHAARQRGLLTCGDQMIAPYQIEMNELQEQHRRWPGWSKSETAVLHEPYRKFEADTWEQLDRVTCMSDYVRDGLISVGVPAEKITVIPHAWNSADEPWQIDAGSEVPSSRGACVASSSSGQKAATQASPPRMNLRDRRLSAIQQSPLTVGFVGAVGLRKGAPYFLEVAKRFDPRQVRFVMVGQMLLSPEFLGPYQHVQFIGPVLKSEVKNWLKQFDLFLFPSTCEGSAGAVMEAMAAGLPVLTTPNSGSRVRHGIDGLIHRYDEIDQFELAIRQLDANRDLLHRMGESACQRIHAYDINAYAADLKILFNGLRN